MNKIKHAVIITTLLAALPLVAQEQQRAHSTGGASPHETTSTVINGDRVTLTYGRPYTKKPGTDEIRKIWGGLVPYGQVWRTGADEATILITQKPIVIGDTTVPAGAYTLFTLPAEDGSAKLIINKQIGQWGLQYKESEDLARVDMKKETLDNPVDQFTMAIARNPAGGGILKMSWENTQYSVPFTVQK